MPPRPPSELPIPRDHEIAKTSPAKSGPRATLTSPSPLRERQRISNWFYILERGFSQVNLTHGKWALSGSCAVVLRNLPHTENKKNNTTGVRRERLLRITPADARTGPRSPPYARAYTDRDTTALPAESGGIFSRTGTRKIILRQDLCPVTCGTITPGLALPSSSTVPLETEYGAQAQEISYRPIGNSNRAVARRLISSATPDFRKG